MLSWRGDSYKKKKDGRKFKEIVGGEKLLFIIKRVWKGGWND